MAFLAAGTPIRVLSAAWGPAPPTLGSSLINHAPLPRIGASAGGPPRLFFSGSDPGGRVTTAGARLLPGSAFLGRRVQMLSCCRRGPIAPPARPSAEFEASADGGAPAPAPPANASPAPPEWTPAPHQPLKATRGAVYISPDGAMRVDADFDSGNGRLVRTSIPPSGSPPDAESALYLEIDPDTNSREFQWFHVRVRCPAGRRLRIVFANAGGAAFARGWQGYRAYWSAGAACEDGGAWEIAETAYDPSSGSLSVAVESRSPETRVAFFVPYSLEQVDALVRRAAASGRCSASEPGASVEGRPIVELCFPPRGEGETAPEGRKHLWIIARQHSGESMASHFVDGLVSRLLEDDDPSVDRILAAADVHVVPVMNPDGVFWGNLRNNASGLDLNRQWFDPDPVRAPEVACVRRRMAETGVHFFLDAHGDEGMPYVFVAGTDGVPSFDEARVGSLQERFKAIYADVNLSFQDRYNYGRRRRGTANLGIATSFVGERHRCLAFTLEMPFKADANNPDGLRGFGAARCRRLGADLLHVLAALVDDL